MRDDERVGGLRTVTTNKQQSGQASSKRSYFNRLVSKGNYSDTSNNTKLVHWPLMGGLLHLVQRGGTWAGCDPAQSPPRCTKCNSPPINSQCTNHCIAMMVRCSAVLMWRLKS